MIDNVNLRAYCGRLLAKGGGLDFKASISINVAPSTSPSLCCKNLRKRQLSNTSLDETIRRMQAVERREKARRRKSLGPDSGTAPTETCFLRKPPSFWPFGLATSIFVTVFGTVGVLQGWAGGSVVATLGLSMIFFFGFSWYRDLIQEAECERNCNLRKEASAALSKRLLALSVAVLLAALSTGLLF